MGFLGIGNNPMVGCTVACAILLYTLQRLRRLARSGATWQSIAVSLLAATMTQLYMFWQISEGFAHRCVISLPKTVTAPRPMSDLFLMGRKWSQNHHSKHS